MSDYILVTLDVKLSTVLNLALSDGAVLDKGMIVDEVRNRLEAAGADLIDEVSFVSFVVDEQRPYVKVEL